ncbi:MAG: hypothetical protein P4L56_01205 [Candidatus Sulfopaludibacter sp.]|nr:hypothetical protein [Candidatus Sulfopaludibacter sp.]
MRAVCVWVPAFAIWCAVAGQAQDNPAAAGYILKCAGQWTASLNGQDRPLQAGVAVKPGEQLHSNPPNALLGLVLYDGTYLKCPNSDKCKQPIRIPPREQAQSAISAFLDQLENKHLPPVAFVTSRAAASGPPPVELRDAVVPSGAARLDLSSVLSAAPPVELHLYMEPLDAPAGCGATLFKLPAQERSVEAGDFQPKCNGLYQLSGTGDSMEGAYPATVLIVAPADQARAAHRLAQALELTAKWQSAGEDERRTFLRLTLGAIQQSLKSSR